MEEKLAELLTGATFFAFVMMSVVAWSFWREEGRFRLYLGVMLTVVAIECGVAAITNLVAQPEDLSMLYAVPRLIIRLAEGLTALGVLLFFAGKLNGPGKSNK